jgi:hypothetical protein
MRHRCRRKHLRWAKWVAASLFGNSNETNFSRFVIFILVTAIPARSTIRPCVTRFRRAVQLAVTGLYQSWSGCASPLREAWRLAGKAALDATATA